MQDNNNINQLEVQKDKFTNKKNRNEKFLNIFEKYASVKNYLNVENCGTYLEFLTDESEQNIKLYKANFCKNRFCPMCAWRRSLKDSLVISILMKYIEEKYKIKFYFMTLTVVSVKGEELKEKIEHMSKSFDKMMRRKTVKNLVSGYLKKLEVNYQKEEFITKELYVKKEKYYRNKGLKVGDKEPNFNTYNPHYHCIIAMPNSKKSELSITEKEWLKMWKEATGDNNISQVKFDRITKNDNKEVLEIAKYSAKDSDYLVNENVFGIFYYALKNKQMLTFSGVFKEALKLFKKGELDYLMEFDNIEYIYTFSMSWVKKEYIINELKELPKEEYERINKRLNKELKEEY